MFYTLDDVTEGQRMFCTLPLLCELCELCLEFAVTENGLFAGQLVNAEEDLGLSKISWHVYGRYIKACGGICLLLVVLFAFMANVGSTIFCTAWLSYWLKEGEKAVRPPESQTGSCLQTRVSFRANVTSR